MHSDFTSSSSGAKLSARLSVLSRSAKTLHFITTSLISYDRPCFLITKEPSFLRNGDPLWCIVSCIADKSRFRSELCFSFILLLLFNVLFIIRAISGLSSFECYFCWKITLVNCQYHLLVYFAVPSLSRTTLHSNKISILVLTFRILSSYLFTSHFMDASPRAEILFYCSLIVW